MCRYAAVCLQETKLSSRGDLDAALACPAGWDSFFSVCRAPGKGGYAGTAVFCRLPMRVFAAEEGVTGALALDAPAAAAAAAAGGGIAHYGGMRERFTPRRMVELDAEGRALVVDFESFGGAVRAESS